MLSSFLSVKLCSISLCSDTSPSQRWLEVSTWSLYNSHDLLLVFVIIGISFIRQLNLERIVSSRLNPLKVRVHLLH